MIFFVSDLGNVMVLTSKFHLVVVDPVTLTVEPDMVYVQDNKFVRAYTKSTLVNLIYKYGINVFHPETRTPFTSKQHFFLLKKFEMIQTIPQKSNKWCTCF